MYRAKHDSYLFCESSAAYVSNFRVLGAPFSPKFFQAGRFRPARFARWRAGRSDPRRYDDSIGLVVALDFAALASSVAAGCSGYPVVNGCGARLWASAVAGAGQALVQRGGK